MKRLIPAMLLGLCLAAPDAHALTVNVNDNIADGTLIKAGDTLSGSFDINTEVPAGGSYFLPYSITGASYTIKLTDDLSDLTVLKPVVGQYSFSRHLNSQFDEYVRVSTQWTMDENEVVSLSIAGTLVAQKGTQSYTIPLSISGNNVHESTNTQSTPKIKYYIQNQVGTFGNKGDILFTSLLDTAQLGDLSQDGIIGFSLTGIEGDIIYMSGSLTADLDPNSVPTAAAAPVPEPGTLVLVGAGLAGLAIYARRKRG